MNTIAIFWHELVLRHGSGWIEMRPSRKRSRKFGVVVECPCGKRWLTRAPWFREV